MIALHLTHEELNAGHLLATRQPACRPYAVFAAVDGPLWLFSAQWARKIRTNAHGEDLICLPYHLQPLPKKKHPSNTGAHPAPATPFPFSLLTFCAAIFSDVYLKPYNITWPPPCQAQIPPPLGRCERGPHRCGMGPEIIHCRRLALQSRATAPNRLGRQSSQKGVPQQSFFLILLHRARRTHLRRTSRRQSRNQPRQNRCGR